MNCDICHRPHHPQRLPFLCPVDARNRLWAGRFSQVGIVVENGQTETQLNQLLETSTLESAPRRLHVENVKSECRKMAGRTGEVGAQIESLRREVEVARKEIARRKAAVARRRADLNSASNGLDSRRAGQLEDVERSSKILRHTWNRSYDSMAVTRAFLCMEAAKLYGLRRVKKSNSARYEYRIGGVDIVDLNSLNDASPEVINTTLAHIAHILVLSSHYLAIKLPAEITLPRRDYPRPTVFSLTSSYRHDEVPFPGSTLLPHGSSGDDQQRLPRPRPLFVDKPLGVLAKEDNAAFSLFVEAVSLLSYDVAWACLTQGVPIGDKNSIEDVFGIGRNLFNLLIGNQRAFQTTAPPGGGLGGVGAADTPETGAKAAANWMGRWSHGTAHTSLANSQGTEFVRSFKLPSPIKVADKLKRKLTTGEAPVPEWELLEDEPWALDDGLEDGVLVHTDSDRHARRSFGVESVMTVQTEQVSNSGGLIGVVGGAGGRAGGSSGWTKLRKS